MTSAARLKNALAENRVFVTGSPYRACGVFLLLFGLGGLSLWAAVLPPTSADPALAQIALFVYWTLAPLALVGFLMVLRTDRLRLDFAADTYQWHRGFFPMLEARRGPLGDFRRVVVGHRAGFYGFSLWLERNDGTEHWLCAAAGLGDKWDRSGLISAGTLLADRLGAPFTNETLPPGSGVEAPPERTLHPLAGAIGETLRWVSVPGGHAYELRGGETVFATLSVTGDDYSARGTGVTASAKWDLERRVPGMVRPEFRIRQAGAAAEWALLPSGTRAREAIRFPSGSAFMVRWTFASPRSVRDSQGVEVLRLSGTKVTLLQGGPEIEPLILLFAFVQFSGPEG